MKEICVYWGSYLLFLCHAEQKQNEATTWSIPKTKYIAVYFSVVEKVAAIASSFFYFISSLTTKFCFTNKFNPPLFFLQWSNNSSCIKKKLYSLLIGFDNNVLAQIKHTRDYFKSKLNIPHHKLDSPQPSYMIRKDDLWLFLFNTINRANIKTCNSINYNPKRT